MIKGKCHRVEERKRGAQITRKRKRRGEFVMPVSMDQMKKKRMEGELRRKKRRSKLRELYDTLSTTALSVPQLEEMKHSRSKKKKDDKKFEMITEDMNTEKVLPVRKKKKKKNTQQSVEREITVSTNVTKDESRPVDIPTIKREMEVLDEFMKKEADQSFWTSAGIERVRNELERHKQVMSDSCGCMDGNEFMDMWSGLLSFFQEEGKRAWWTVEGMERVNMKLKEMKTNVCVDEESVGINEKGNVEEGDNDSSGDESVDTSEDDKSLDDNGEEGNDEVMEIGLSSEVVMKEISPCRQEDAIIVEEDVEIKKDEVSKEITIKEEPHSACDVNRPTRPVLVVERNEEIEKQREQLPILLQEQEIVEAVRENPVLILSGETGCGKSTQVPQMLFEAGLTRLEDGGKLMIGVTQPRRVAAVSVAHRVSTEMSSSVGGMVGYEIRYERRVDDEDTEIKFMTDGILLAEMKRDFLLKRFSVIIIDEAHERRLNTDILIGLLSRCIAVRWESEELPKLRMIIMSATLRMDDFVNNRQLFPAVPPVLSVQTRQYPVTIHHSRRTETWDYVTSAFDMVCKIHRTLPPGGILVFLTGKAEIETLCRRLRSEFQESGSDVDVVSEDEESEDTDGSESDTYNSSANVIREVENVEKEENDSEQCENDEPNSSLVVLPLYSMLNQSAQLRVFRDPPPNSRLCVVSTNVAETSVTIPGVAYVVDSGRVKQRVYAPHTGASSFQVNWISRASADQRSGRAGRTGPGHCYRLYSVGVYGNVMPQHPPPEIQISPLDATVLYMKCLGIPCVSSFPFPSPPDNDVIEKAEQSLVDLGAVDGLNGEPTSLGKYLSGLPVSPRVGKMLVIAAKQQEGRSIVHHMIATVAGLSVREVFIQGPNEEHSEELSEKRKKFRVPECDFLSLLRVIGAYTHEGDGGLFCREYQLHEKSMNEIQCLRRQLRNALRRMFPSSVGRETDFLPPTEEQQVAIRQVMTHCLIDNVARKASKEEQQIIWQEKGVSSVKNWPYVSSKSSIKEPLFIDPSSFLNRDREFCPEYIIYFDIFETSRSNVKYVSEVRPSWLFTLGKNRCSVGDILSSPSSRYDFEKEMVIGYVMPTFGDHSWPLPVSHMDIPEGFQRLQHFAKLFLEGEVFPSLKKWVSHLVSSPSLILHKTCMSSPKVQRLLKALSKCSTTRTSLSDKWSESPEYLLSEYMEWISERYHSGVRRHWPPVNN